MCAELPAQTDLDAVSRTFEAQGYAPLGRVVSDEVLAVLRARADALMLGEVSYPGLFYQHDSDTGLYEDLRRREGFVGPSLRYRKIEKLELDPLFLELIHSKAYEAVARSRISGAISLYRSVLFNKAAHGGTFLPFHQDGGRMWGLDREPSLQIWLTLDDALEPSGCLQMVPGSHREGLVTPLGGVVPDDRVAQANAEEHIVRVPARAGEAVMIHNHLWHRSGVNLTAQPRRAITVCFMSAETKCTRTRRAPRTFLRVFDALEHSVRG